MTRNRPEIKIGGMEDINDQEMSLDDIGKGEGSEQEEERAANETATEANLINENKKH